MKPEYQIERPERTMRPVPRFLLGVVVGVIVTLAALSCWQAVAPGAAYVEQVR